MNRPSYALTVLLASLAGTLLAVGAARGQCGGVDLPAGGWGWTCPLGDEHYNHCPYAWEEADVPADEGKTAPAAGAVDEEMLLSGYDDTYDEAVYGDAPSRPAPCDVDEAPAAEIVNEAFSAAQPWDDYDYGYDYGRNYDACGEHYGACGRPARGAREFDDCQDYFDAEREREQRAGADLADADSAYDEYWFSEEKKEAPTPPPVPSLDELAAEQEETRDAPIAEESAEAGDYGDEYEYDYDDAYEDEYEYKYGYEYHYEYEYDRSDFDLSPERDPADMWGESAPAADPQDEPAVSAGRDSLAEVCRTRALLLIADTLDLVGEALQGASAEIACLAEEREQR